MLPPTISPVCKPWNFPTFLSTSKIWVASSRVGEMMRAPTPSERPHFSLYNFSKTCNKKKARTFYSKSSVMHRWWELSCQNCLVKEHLLPKYTGNLKIYNYNACLQLLISHDLAVANHYKYVWQISLKSLNKKGEWYSCTVTALHIYVLHCATKLYHCKSYAR